MGPKIQTENNSRSNFAVFIYVVRSFPVRGQLLLLLVNKEHRQLTSFLFELPLLHCPTENAS